MVVFRWTASCVNESSIRCGYPESGSTKLPLSESTNYPKIFDQIQCISPFSWGDLSRNHKCLNGLGMLLALLRSHFLEKHVQYTKALHEQHNWNRVWLLLRVVDPLLTLASSPYFLIRISLKNFRYIKQASWLLVSYNNIKKNICQQFQVKVFVEETLRKGVQGLVAEFKGMKRMNDFNLMTEFVLQNPLGRNRYKVRFL